MWSKSVTRRSGPVCGGLSSFSARRDAGFTLIELLIVVAIIALLVSILLPSLSQARNLTRRVMCASNTRMIATGAHQYAAEDAHGMFPPSPSNMNASINWWFSAPIFPNLAALRASNPNDYPENPLLPSSRSVWGYDWTTGWISLGLLFRDKIIDNPEAFTCPALAPESLAGWPKGWTNPDTNKVDTTSMTFSRCYGYFYGIFGQPREYSDPPITLAMVDKLLRMQVNSESILLTDFLFDAQGARGEAPHADPFGVNAAYADGHAAWLELGEKEASRCAAQVGRSVAENDIFTYLYFRAMETGNFKNLGPAGFPAP